MEGNETIRGLLTYAFAAWIPPVAFAIWLQYFSEYLKQARTQGSDLQPLSDDSDDERAAFNPTLELKRLNAAGFFTLISQIVVYLASWSLRENHWWPSAAIFAVTVLVKSSLQSRHEHELRESAPQSLAETSSGLRLILWNVAGIAAYLLLVQLFALGFALLAQRLGLPAAAGLGLTLAGGMLGILSGLALTFALAPTQIRKSMKCEPIRDPELLRVLHSCFERANVAAPEFYSVHTPHSAWHNAWVAGFSRGRGWFRPGLFLTRPLLSQFNLREIEAIVLHEVSHIALSHLQKRFSTTVGLLLLSTAALGVCGALAFLYLPPGTQTLPVLLCSVLSLFLPMRAVRAQVTRQEFEADEAAVERFGASVEVYISVLKKLASLNQLPGAPSTTQPSASGHPPLEARLMRLEVLRAMREAEHQPETQSDRRAA
jgi:Zn-dependent protease with chaperone function